MTKTALWRKSHISNDRTYHETAKGPLYDRRFQEVLSFHSPGLAPAKENGRWFHIKQDGTRAYIKTFSRAFGFYENMAAVEEQGNWFHIHPDGNAAYKKRFAWCGNFQESLCTVRDFSGLFYHINFDGEGVYSERYLYAGDFKEGVAVARRKDGNCIHIKETGKSLTNISFKELGLYHKGYSTVKDQYGWFHIDKIGNSLYNQRYLLAEPFYNGLALCVKFNGKNVRVNTSGEEVEQIDQTENRQAGRKILLIGNLSSGKTTLANIIKNELNIQAVGIDYCRHKVSDGSISGEYLAWAKFFEFCESSEDYILEFSGGGPHIYNIARALELSGSKIYIIFLDASIDECLSASSKRVFNAPYPCTLGDLRELVLHIDNEIKMAWGNVWTKRNFRTLRILNPRKNAHKQSLTFLGDTK